MMKWENIVNVILLVVLVVFGLAQSQSTTPSVDTECLKINGSCETCVGNAKCLWCPTRRGGCVPYPVGQLIPHADFCDLGDARWGVCWVNYKTLLIAMGSIAGLILLSITCCCVYCCCCKSNGKARRKYMKEEAKTTAQAEERKVKSDERRADRKVKHDEIRKKYGLQFKGQSGLIKEDNPYQRFDDNNA